MKDHTSADVHPHLQRQLRAIGANQDGPPTLSQWHDLLARVSDNYFSDDRERRLQDRAWEISSQEMRELNEKLARASASELARERDRLTTVLQTTNTGLCLLDDEHRLVEINQAGARFLSCDPQSALGTELIDHLWSQELDADHPPAALRAAIVEGVSWTGEGVPMRLADGERATVAIVFTPLSGEGSNGGLLAFHDLTAQQQAAAEVAWRASHDPLTGLLNRAAVTTAIDDSLRAMDSRTGRSAVLFIDLDRFKNVNDTSGHDVGDTVLVEAASRIRNAVRVDDVVARLGGDEFVVYLENLPGPSAIDTVAQRILGALRLPYRVAGQLMHLSGSIGYATSGSGSDSAGLLLRNADIALYRAKAAGRDQAVAFGEDLRETVEQRVALDRQLRTAVANHELTVAFQPLVDLRSQRIVGYETLCRWPRMIGHIGPDQFIPLAEENGLIGSIGEMALREAASMAAEVDAQPGNWPRRGVVVAVNVSGVQLSRGGFAQIVERTLATAHLHPRSLMIEITESTLLTHGDRAQAELERLHALGVRIALDDFGTGWSSLSMLQRFPIDCIKIDRSFVASMDINRDNRAIVQAVIELGRALGHEVIAEGVETAEQAELLRSIGCTLAQGYLFGRPTERAKLVHPYPAAANI